MHFSWRHFLALTCLLLIAGLIAGCAQAPHKAGVLHLVQKADPTTLDPAKAYDTTSIQFVRLLYRGLVDYDFKANLYNEVAASRTVSPDGKTYTFKLRPDVRFTSGRQVTAEDFRYALERVLDPGTASDGLSLYTMIDGAEDWSNDRKGPKKLKHVRGIEVPNPDTIIFKLNKADATFLNYLALPFAYAIPAEHVAALEKDGKELSENPVGCGPFKLEEWLHDGWINLVKNPDYFHKDLPKCDRIEAKFGIDDTLQTMLFEQGNLDILPITDAPPPDFLRLKESRKWAPYILHAPMMDLRYMSMNNELPPFTDVRVRRAVNYAIDRKRIAEFRTGRATVARGALPPGMPAYNPQLFQYEYNPDKAKQLLKEAGYKGDPADPIVLWYSDNEAWYEKAALSMQRNLSEVGMYVTLKKLRYGDLKAKAGTRKAAKLAIMGWLQDFPDPSNFLDPLYNARSIHDEASLNRSFYSNPKVNQILDAAIVETDRAKRLRMYQDAEKIIVADAPMVFLNHTERYIIRQPWVDGFALHPMWSAVYENVTIKP